MYNKLTPIQTLLFGFLVLIVAGALLLLLPASLQENKSLTFLDALFTASSAVSTTGLGVVDTGTHFSRFGQLVILLLVQIGGLGYMIFISLIALGIGARFSISERLLLNESLARPTTVEIKKFIRSVIIFSVGFEVIGAVFLSILFLKQLPFSEAVYSGVFHSISAFCTAGFSLYADSFISYAESLPINFIIACLSIGGGIGFFVLYDIVHYVLQRFRKKYPQKISDHSKFVISLTVILIVVGTAVLFFIESSTNQNISPSEQLLTASFQVISASTTTGFNSVDIGSMHKLSLLYIIVLMFIGASPGSTGGGIKTTSFGIIILFIRSVLTNREKITAFHRTIVTKTVAKALGIGILALLYLLLLSLILFMTENLSFTQILFEAASALGTVGLSTGITSQLSDTGKILITITMFVGRLGPLAIGYSLIGKTKQKDYAYPDGNVMVG